MSSSDHLRARLRTSLGRVDPRREWPQGFVRLGVAVCVAVVAALGLVYLVRAVDRLGADATENAAANYDDRDFGGGNALGVDQEALSAARGWIPEHGTYRLAVGPSATDVDQFARYFLMPRRPDPDARWVLCYACDRSRFGDRLRVVWQNDDGIAIGRLPG